ncbi:hypothetical protein [Winogradskyella sp.]|uniref:hypothetical protein n=1 Tax=Winogradskyella sp. TaxID=1883156 RepID=UPI00262C5511|nr:hypothetical protein [Winogradskyella sp.]
MKIIKCINCGVYNKNRDRCKNCDALLSYKKRRAQQIKAENTERLEKAKKSPPDFIENLQQHRYIMFRVLGWILYSAFVVVSAIGAFIAWLVFAIAAG